MWSRERSLAAASGSSASVPKRKLCRFRRPAHRPPKARHAGSRQRRFNPSVVEWGDPQEPTEISISHRIDETQQAWTQPQSSDVSEDLPYSALTHTSLGGRGTCYRMTRRQAVKLYESKAVARGACRASRGRPWGSPVPPAHPENPAGTRLGPRPFSHRGASAPIGPCGPRSAPNSGAAHRWVVSRPPRALQGPLRARSGPAPPITTTTFTGPP